MCAHVLGNRCNRIAVQQAHLPICCEQENPALLWNHGNEYLNYEDDWYILASKPNEYVVIYYKGGNDAWKGYGGATVYTRCTAYFTDPYHSDITGRIFAEAGLTSVKSLPPAPSLHCVHGAQIQGFQDLQALGHGPGPCAPCGHKTLLSEARLRHESSVS